MSIPPKFIGGIDELSPAESQEAFDRLERQSFLARFGISRPPEIVTSSTVLPTIPTVPSCGDRRPKLNLHQLIALAIIHHGTRSPTGQDIVDWILSHFKYFDKIEPTHLEARLRESFVIYDPPIVPLSETYRHFAMAWEQKQYLSLRYAIVVGHYSVIFPTSPKTFPLMKLPAELRLHVYEYALGKPCEQLTKIPYLYWDWGNNNERKRAHGYIHSYVEYDSDACTAGSWHGSTFFRCLRAERVLSLLSVSKKVREEALPAFYRVNNFGSGSIFSTFNNMGNPDNGSFDLVLKRMGNPRRSYLRSLTIAYDPYRAKEVFTLLGDCQELENLCIEFRLCYWWAKNPPDDVSQLPGFDAIGALRGIKRLRILGCDTPEILTKIQAYLEPLVTQPRNEPEAVMDEEAARKKLKMDTANT